MLQIEITDVNSVNAKDAIYKVDYKSDLPQYSVKAQTQLQRKYSDFQWLLGELQLAHQDCIVPALSAFKPSSLTSLASFTASSSSANAGSAVVSGGVGLVTVHTPAQVDEKLKEHLQLFCNQLSAHPKLQKSSVLQQFLEASPSQFIPQSSSSSGSGGSKKSGGVSSFFKSVAKQITSSAKPAQEIDSWFENHRLDADTLSAQLDRGFKCAEKISKLRRSIAAYFQEMATKTIELGAGESNSTLSMSLRKFASGFDKSSHLYALSSENDVIQMLEPVETLSKYCDNTKKTFDNRSAVLADYENACKNSLKKKQTVEKLKTASQVRHDKVEAALIEFNEAQNIENDTKESLRKISEEIKQFEWTHFQHNVNANLSQILHAYARAQIQVESRILQDFESILPDFGASKGDVAALSTATDAAKPGKIAAEIL